MGKIIHDYNNYFQVTFTCVSPYILNNLLQVPHLSNYNTSSLQSLVVGGGAVGKKQLLDARKKFPHTSVYLIYGMTENHGFNTYFNPVLDKEEMYKRVESVGRGLPGYTYKVFSIIHLCFAYIFLIYH